LVFDPVAQGIVKNQDGGAEDDRQAHQKGPPAEAPEILESQLKKKQKLNH
jgi:hypothetical protein